MPEGVRLGAKWASNDSAAAAAGRHAASCDMLHNIILYY